jgi:hypothetical protein
MNHLRCPMLHHPTCPLTGILRPSETGGDCLRHKT